MFGWLKKYRHAVRAEADERMEYFGNHAYKATREEARVARKVGNRKRDKFLGKVALEIAKRTDFDVVVDTATRYLDEQAPYDSGPSVARNKNATLH